MKTIVGPSEYNGELKANPSKSVMQRVVAIASLGSKATLITNIDQSEDSKAALRVAESIGAKVEINDTEVRITPGDKLRNTVWNVGESGLSTRMFAPVAGLFEQDITITGKGSLLTRPMNSVIEALEKLGLDVEHNNGLLPLKIKGTISNHRLQLDLSSGSQILTGLMIALSKAGEDSVIEVTNLKSKPYIDLTACVLVAFGNRISNRDYTRFEIPGNAVLQRDVFDVEGDWSGVAFHLVGAAIAGKVTIKGINPNSKQSDKAILQVLNSVGADLIIEKKSVTVSKNKLLPFEFDATDAPDLFPPLAVLAAYCDGVSKIKGVSRLQHKESDRYAAIREEFGKVGIQVKKQDDYMLIFGGKPRGGIVDSHSDHRIAMAMAILALGALDKIEINNSECISKSYPGFFDDYESLSSSFF